MELVEELDEIISGVESMKKPWHTLIDQKDASYA